VRGRRRAGGLGSPHRGVVGTGKGRLVTQRMVRTIKAGMYLSCRSASFVLDPREHEERAPVNLVGLVSWSCGIVGELSYPPRRPEGQTPSQEDAYESTERPLRTRSRDADCF
jgi:hypothetical protein